MTKEPPERFLEACGGLGPLRLLVKRPEWEATAPTVEESAQPYMIVGRDERVDLRLDDLEVSRRHAYLQMIGGQVFAIDLQSRTSTHWPDGPRPMGWLPATPGAGPGIGIGPYQIDAVMPGPRREVARSDGEGPALPTLREFELPDLVEAGLEVLDPSVTKTFWRISRALVLLGRTRPCWVRLPSRDVSRIHCSLVRTPVGIWVIDLLSREGVHVNGARVHCARLDEGDELRIGPHRVRLRYMSGGIRAARPVSLPMTAPMPPALPEAHALPVLSAEPELGRILAGRAESGDSILVPLLKELGQMQQQMADQFQQALMMMFQLFSSMHQDQMGLIREELAQIQRLNAEQQRLQAELAKQAEAARAEASRPTLRVVAAEAEAMGGGPRPQSASRSERLASTRREPAAARKESTQQQHAATGQDDLHTLLAARLAAIQEERQGRWQKLIKSVMGNKATGEASS